MAQSTLMQCVERLRKAVKAQQTTCEEMKGLVVTPAELRDDNHKKREQYVKRVMFLSGATAESAEELCSAVEKAKLWQMADSMMISSGSGPDGTALKAKLQEIQSVLTTPSTTPRLAPQGGPRTPNPEYTTDLERKVAQLQSQLLEAKALSGDQLAVREGAMLRAQEAAAKQRIELEDEAVRIRAAQVTYRLRFVFVLFYLSLFFWAFMKYVYVS